MKPAEITALLKSINANHKAELFVVLGDPDARSQEIKRVVCDRLSIDLPFGGGFPVGRIIEIYGAESSGKTTIALHGAAAFQRDFEDKAVAMVDYEHAFDKSYAASLGVNTDTLVLAQPIHMEQGLQGIDNLIDTGKFSLIIVDSVAAMLPKSELEGDMGKSAIGVQAKMMSQAMRKLVGKAHKTETTIIFINQTREKIGVMFGSPITTSGGNALKFYASIRAEVRRGAKQSEKDGDGNSEVVSNRGKIVVVKNKTYPPYKESEFDIEFGTGISRESDILDYAVLAGVIEKKGSWYNYYDGEGKDRKKIVIGQGKPAAIEFLKTNEKYTTELSKVLLDSLI